ncbi:MAG: AAA family ATPase, partial [Lachnospiraceae bacterium]|nr:AAA family ATPase [Lachnospiraceae bacterium]
MSKGTVYAIVNQKGGTGKTQSAENIGIGLAEEGKKVLLVDLDPQASLTISLGYPMADDIPVTITDIMANVLQEIPIESGEGIIHHTEGVDLMPANISLAGMEVSLVNALGRERILREYLDTVKHNYDAVLLDCSPSLGMLTINAM